MFDLTKLPNIGKELANRLNTVGVYTKDALLLDEAEEVFIKVKTVYPQACINHLYAIEGAIQGIRWHGLPKVRKEELKVFFDSLV